MDTEKQLPTVAPVNNNTATTNLSRNMVRTPYPLHKSRWVLRAIAFLFEFIAFFIIVGLSARCNIKGGEYCNVISNLLWVGLPMVWNIAEFITLCVNHKGIHPGAHIALDLILFGLLDGPGSIIIVVYSYFSDRYYNDCSDSEVCSGVSNSRRLSFRPGGIAIGTLIIIAGLVHLALFILACISVHKWRMARRDRRHAQMQAAYSNPTGQISVAGNMDPNTAYIVTYPDGRQVIVPPQTQQQQQPTPQPHGYYAPPAQQNMTPVPHSHGISPAPVAMGAGTLGAGALAGQHMTSQNTSHSPVSQLSQPLPDGQRAVPESVVSGRTATDSLYAHSHNDVAEAPAVGNMPRPAEAVPEQR